MQYYSHSSGFVVRLDRGEEVIKTLTEFCKAQKITAGSLSAIGAMESATLAYFERDTKKYHTRTFTGDLEVTPLIGNITLKDGEPFLHCHLTISDDTYATYGGHVMEAIVNPTLEVMITVFDAQISREHNAEVGLNLLH